MNCAAKTNEIKKKIMILKTLLSFSFFNKRVKKFNNIAKIVPINNTNIIVAKVILLKIDKINIISNKNIVNIFIYIELIFFMFTPFS